MKGVVSGMGVVDEVEDIVDGCLIDEGYLMGLRGELGL